MPDPILPLADLVPTRETCERLAEAGFLDDTYFAWVQAYGTKPWQVAKAERMYASITGDNLLPAPTLSELTEVLPDPLEIDGSVCFLQYRAGFATYRRRDDISAQLQYTHERIVEAAALLYLELDDRGLLPDDSE